MFNALFAQERELCTVHYGFHFSGLFKFLLAYWLTNVHAIRNTIPNADYLHRQTEKKQRLMSTSVTVRISRSTWNTKWYVNWLLTQATGPNSHASTVQSNQLSMLSFGSMVYARLGQRLTGPTFGSMLMPAEPWQNLLLLLLLLLIYVYEYVDLKCVFECVCTAQHELECKHALVHWAFALIGLTKRNRYAKLS